MIKISVQDTQGETLGTFLAEKGTTIIESAKNNNVEIPFSCGAGACGMCLCYIIKGGDLINKEYSMPSFMELDDDQVLTCIAAIKDECFDMEGEQEVVLKRAI